MANIMTGIKNWFTSFFCVWRRETYLTLHDFGVLLFFIGLPLLYPITYTLIYNPEVIRDLPIAVIDQSRTAESRHLARMIDATEGLEVYTYATDREEARRLMHSKEVFGTLEIPANYAQCLGRGEQAVVTYFADMSLLLRYRTAAFALTDVQIAICEELRNDKINSAGLLLQNMDGSPIATDQYMLGDVTQGFASFIMPGVLVLILHQGLFLGVGMMAGAAWERRRRNGGIDPMAVPAPAAATIIGKSLCYVMLYIPMVVFVVWFVPAFFSLPHVGSVWQEVIFLLPMLFAVTMMGQCMGAFIHEREAVLLIIVASSVVFLFLSGLTWPLYAMNGFWQLVGDFIPSTWGIEGFIRLTSNGATPAEEAQPYVTLWCLTAIYFSVAWLLARVGRLYPRPRLA